MVTPGSEGSATEVSALDSGGGVIGVLTNGVDWGVMLVQATSKTAMRAKEASLVARTVSLLKGRSRGAYVSASAAPAQRSPRRRGRYDRIGEGAFRGS